MIYDIYIYLLHNIYYYLYIMGVRAAQHSSAAKHGFICPIYIY